MIADFYPRIVYFDGLEFNNFSFRLSNIPRNLFRNTSSLLTFGAVLFAQFGSVNNRGINNKVNYVETINHLASYTVYKIDEVPRPGFLNCIAPLLTVNQNNCSLQAAQVIPLSFTEIQKWHNFYLSAGEIHSAINHVNQSVPNVNETLACLTDFIQQCQQQYDDYQAEYDANRNREMIIIFSSVFGFFALALTLGLIVTILGNRRTRVAERDLERQPLLDQVNAPVVDHENHEDNINPPVEQNRQQLAESGEQQMSVLGSVTITPLPEKSWTDWMPDSKKSIVERISFLSQAEIELANEFIFSNDECALKENLVCPISREIMANPVLALDGFHYDKPSLDQYFGSVIQMKSPKTNELMPNNYMSADFYFKQKIMDYVSDKEKELIALLNKKMRLSEREKKSNLVANSLFKVDATKKISESDVVNSKRHHYSRSQ